MSDDVCRCGHPRSEHREGIYECLDVDCGCPGAGVFGDPVASAQAQASAPPTPVKARHRKTTPHPPAHPAKRREGKKR